MTELNQNEAVRLFLSRVSDYTVIQSAALKQGVADVWGRDVSEVMPGPLRSVLERWGHGDGKNKPVVLCILFANTTLHGNCPLQHWIDCGGTAESLKRGNYIKLPDGSREDVLWWEDDSEGMDIFGRPETGRSDSDIDAMIAANLDEDGSIGVSQAAALFNLKGSRPRDRRARSRVYLAQSKRYQSPGGGRYYDTEGDLPAHLYEQLVERAESRVRAATIGDNKRMEHLKSPMRFVWGIVPMTALRGKVGGDYRITI